MATWVTERAAIRRIAAAVPVSREAAEDAAGRFGLEEVRKLAASTGVSSRRVAPEGVCASDLAIAAAGVAIGDVGWQRDAIDAILFVSQTPDYRLPATACSMHKRLGLSKRCLAFDVNLGCSGYVYGLFLAAQLVSSGAARRVLLTVGDTINRFVDPADRATALLFGDAASATLVEADSAEGRMSFVLGTDGLGADHLIIPSGGARDLHASTPGRTVEAAGERTIDPKCLHMNGAEVFAFSLREVPSMITQVVELAGWSMESLDLVVLHQANAFMLNHLTKKLKLPPAKVPIAMEGLGNTSSASVPVALCCSSGRPSAALQRVVLGGFGVGYSWAAAALGLAAGAVLPLIEVGEAVSAT